MKFRTTRLGMKSAHLSTLLCILALPASDPAAAIGAPSPQASAGGTGVIHIRGDDQTFATPPDTDRSEFARLTREGIRLFLDRQYQPAVDILAKAIALEPDNWLAYYHRGIAFQRLKSYAQALSDFTVVIEKGPPIDFAYLNRGAVRAKLGLMREAESDFDAALKIDPTRPDTYFNRALLFLKTSRGQEAIDDISKGIGFNPKDAKAYFLRASALETFHRHDEVRRDLEEALRIDPALLPAQDLLKRLEHD